MRDSISTLLKSQALLRSVLAIFSMLIFLVIGIVVYIQTEKQNQNSFQKQFGSIEKSLATLKTMPIDELEDKINVLQTDVGKLSEQKNSAAQKQQLGQLTKSLKDIEGTVLKKEIVDPTIFFTLDLLKSEGVIDQMTGDERGLIFLDRSHQLLYRISLEKKSEILANSVDLSQSSGIVLDEKDIVYSGTNGLYQLGLDGGSQLIASKSAEQEISPMIAAFDGNIYSLDRVNQQIWKYPFDGVTLQPAIPFVSEDTPFSFSQTNDWGIDGWIWVIRENQLWKFLSGDRQQIITELPFSEKSLLFVSSDSEPLFIFDTQKSKLIAFNKEGRYVKQWQITKPIEVIDFIIIKNTVYLTSRDTIYSFPIENYENRQQ